MKRKPGTPIGKFVLYMDPAPVCLGSRDARKREWKVFTDADCKRGGRQIDPDWIEFYTRDDPTSVRLDLWIDEHPVVEGQESIFVARLRVDHDSVSLWSFDETYDVKVASGEYDVSVTLINRGKHEDRSLTHEERFHRDDLERYEVLLKPSPSK